MVKFVHTSDWQIGMKAKHVSQQADKLREARLKATERLILASQEENCDFIIIAGDLFEDNAVDPVLVQRIIDLLSKAPCAIYLIPGNHDPLTPNSVYSRGIWERAGSNVHILSKPEPVQVGQVILYPCPVFEKSSRVDPTSWIPVEEQNRIRIGIAHGSLLIRDDIPKDDFPIAYNSAEKSHLDYLALGHWHSIFKYKGTDGVERTIYSGTHETTKFGESQCGKALSVEIQGPESKPQIREIHTGILNWNQWRRSVINAGDIRDLMAELEQIENPGSVLLELVLEGTLDVQGLTLVQEELNPLLESRYLHHRLNIENLLSHPTEAELQQLAQQGPIRETINRISRMANPESGMVLPEGVTPEIATRALSLLYSLLKEAQL
jgi:DNA repair exonuclease SbcCD nuclease subunit